MVSNDLSVLESDPDLLIYNRSGYSNKYRSWGFEIRTRNMAVKTSVADPVHYYLDPEPDPGDPKRPDPDVDPT